MASLIPGFEYDIFISYRQKDNKGDRWVSEFVEALKTELESTFKDEISVYFDISPHDGLLETHDVDASLKEKLKCLIFIPVLSRTYCDPRSFAWEHEFKAFVEQSSNDKFGLKVKLSGGNVANRILPVRIHDLNISDVELFESTIGGVLRGVDFIYKSAGVNRPLRANEDHPHDNLNKTYYRDQINKVANAIEEIISSLASDQPVTGKEKAKLWEPEKEIKNGDKRKELIKKELVSRKSKKLLILTLSVFLFVTGVFALFKIIEDGKKSFDIRKLEKSIAVLPFINDSPDQENTYFINGLMDEVLNSLQKVKEFRVISRSSVEQYRDATRPTLPEMAKKLDVNYIVEGSGQKYGNKFVLRVQLIVAKNERHLWGESYTKEIRETSDIIGIQSQVAQAIAAELKTTISPEEKQLIDKKFTTDLTALDFYQRGDDDMNKYFSNNRNYQSLKNAEEMYKKALKYDSAFARAYLGLADVYAEKHIFDKSYYSENYLDSVLIFANRALSFDDHLEEGYFWRAQYYYGTGNIEQAAKEFEKAIKYNPNFSAAYYDLGYLVYILDYNQMDYVKGLQYIHKGASIEHGEDRAHILRNLLGDAYGVFAGFPEKREYYYEEAFKLDNDTNSMKGFKTDEEVIGSLKRHFIKDSSNVNTAFSLAVSYMQLGQNKEALRYFRKIEKKFRDNESFRNELIFYQSRGIIGRLYWLDGNKKEAEKWFNEQIKLDEESLKLGREYSIDANFDLASIYEITGEKEKAYENLRIVNKIRICPFWMINVIKDKGSFKSMRNEPEFQRITSELEAKYEAEHKRVSKWLEEQEKL